MGSIMDEMQRYEIAHYQRQSRKCYEAATEIIRRSLEKPLYGAYPNTPARWLPMWEDAARWRARGDMWAKKARILLFLELPRFTASDIWWEGRP